MDCSGTSNKGREGGDTIANEEVALTEDDKVKVGVGWVSLLLVEAQPGGAQLIP